MADHLANTILEKFTALNDEYNAIITESETDLREYNDYCNQSDEDLSEKLSEIRAKISRLNEFMEYARAHATDLEEAEMAFETEMDALETLRSQIDPKSENDYHAETLYTKASAQKKIFEADMERTTKKINGSKVQAKRMLDHQNSELEARRAKHAQEFREYIASDEFKGYIKALSADAAAFNSSGTSKLGADAAISIGQRRVKLPVPMEFDEELSLSTGGVFNSAAKTIGVPFSLDVSGGCSLYVEYDKRNESYMLGGIQRFLLNILKYYGEGLDGIFFADPVHYNSDGLGHIAALSKGMNSIIENIPENASDLKSRFFELKNSLSPADESSKGVKRVFVFHGFPTGYDEETRFAVAELAQNAQDYNAVVVVTHQSSSGGMEPSAEDIMTEGAFKGFAEVVKTRNGGFYVEKTRDSLFWYSAPSDLPGDIRQTYIEQRRRIAAQNSVRLAQSVPVPVPAPAAVQPEPAAVQPVTVPAQPAAAEEPAETPVEPVSQPETAEEPVQTAAETSGETEEKNPDLPAYNKGTRAITGIPCGTDTDGNMLTTELSDVMFVCGTVRAGRDAFLRNIVGGVIAKYHPDDVEMWLCDFTGTRGDLTALCAPHVRYTVSCGAACPRGAMFMRALIDRLCEVLEKRLALYRADASSQEYSPTLIAVVDGFTAACAGLSEEYAQKLRTLFAQGPAAGMKFVLADETYTVNGAVPAYFADGAVRHGVAMSSADSGILSLFNGILLTPSDKSSVANIPLHYAFVRTDSEKNGSYLRLVKVPETYTAEQLEALCGRVDGAMHASDAFEHADVCAYVSKRPVHLTGADRSFDSVKLPEGGAKQLFVGTPCTALAEALPITLSDRFGGNVLVRCADGSRCAAAAAAGAALSWAGEGGEVVLAASCVNEQLSMIALNEAMSSAQVVSELDELCGLIKQTKSAIMSGISADRLTVIFGADLMCAEMSTLTAEGFAGRCDARADLAFILSQGPRLGYHFMLLTNGGVTDAAVIASCSVVLTEKDGLLECSCGGRTNVLAPYAFCFDGGKAQDLLF